MTNDVLGMTMIDAVATDLVNIQERDTMISMTVDMIIIVLLMPEVILFNFCHASALLSMVIGMVVSVSFTL